MCGAIFVDRGAADGEGAAAERGGYVDQCVTNIVERQCGDDTAQPSARRCDVRRSPGGHLGEVREQAGDFVVEASGGEVRAECRRGEDDPGWNARAKARETGETRGFPSDHDSIRQRRLMR